MGFNVLEEDGGGDCGGGGGGDGGGDPCFCPARSRSSRRRRPWCDGSPRRVEKTEESAEPSLLRNGQPAMAV